MIRRRQQGQASVELALVLPFVVVLLLAVVQVAVVVRTQLLVAHAARAGARAAAVDPRPGVARAAALSSSSALKPDRLATETSHHGDAQRLVIVRVRYAVRTDVPLVGALIPDVPLESSAIFRDEYGQSTTLQRKHQGNQQERRHRATKSASGG